MKIVRDDIPTEGIIIENITFRPGVPQEVKAELGEQLIARKGFKEVGKSKKNSKECDE